MTLNREAIKAEIKSWARIKGLQGHPQYDYFILNSLDEIFAHLLQMGLVQQYMYEGFIMGANIAWYRKSG